MTRAIPGEREDTFATTYDRLARAWVDRENLRGADAAISDLYQSSLRLSEAREEMWAWWRNNQLQGVQ